MKAVKPVERNYEKKLSNKSQDIGNKVRQKHERSEEDERNGLCLVRRNLANTIGVVARVVNATVQ